METPRGAGALCTVTSLYLFTDRRVQRWVRYSSSAGSAAQEQGFSLIPEACLLIFLGDLSSSRELKGTVRKLSERGLFQLIMSTLKHTKKNLLITFIQSDVYYGCMQGIKCMSCFGTPDAFRWSPEVFWTLCSLAAVMALEIYLFLRKCLFFDSFLSGSRLFL